jgi:phosphate transport system ATP-binding protein
MSNSAAPQGAPTPPTPESAAVTNATPKPLEASTPVQLRMQVRNLNFYYGKLQALRSINLDVAANRVTALIGPSGCGKSTLLRTLNRMYETVRHTRLEGEIRLDGEDILAQDVTRLRRRVGMVFQRPNPFPLSVYENVAYGPRIHGLSRGDLDERVEKALRQTGLWEVLKDRVDAPALALPPEQQQRICISRLLAVEPEVLLMDEPTSALDPIATARIEELLVELKSRYTIVIVTHNMQQAARISDYTAFMLLGELVEVGETQTIFTLQSDPRTEQYISGRFG